MNKPGKGILKFKEDGKDQIQETLVPLLIWKKSAPRAFPTYGLFPHNEKIKGHKIIASVLVIREVTPGDSKHRTILFLLFLIWQWVQRSCMRS